MKETESIVDLGDIEAFNVWFDQRRIKYILYDLDGTLIDTDTQFTGRRKEVLNFILHTHTGLDAEKFTETYNWANSYAYYRRSVSIDRWELVLTTLKNFFPDLKDTVLDESLVMFRDLYKEAAPLHPGALKLLKTTRSSKAQQGLKTHANLEWTNKKLELLDIRSYFERIFVVDETSFKDTQSWAGAIHSVGVLPSQVLVIEDNVQGGIWAAYKAGVTNLVWIDLHNGWSMYKNGSNNLPPGTMTVKNAVDLIDVVKEEVNSYK